MHTDEYGLPMQADGDRQDQLNRVGLLLTALWLSPIKGTNGLRLLGGLFNLLQPRRGVYTRFTGSPENNVTADQLLPVLACYISARNKRGALWMLFRLLCRLGFAQNTRKIEGGKWKLPDFMLLRALPLLCRIHWVTYPLALIADLYLLVTALACRLPVWRDDSLLPVKRSPDDVDDNNAICTFVTCRKILPTPVSIVAARLYGALRPVNYGVTKLGAENNIIGALRWYHRAESGGNPEVAEVYRELVNEVFYGGKK